AERHGANLAIGFQVGVKRTGPVQHVQAALQQHGRSVDAAVDGGVSDFLGNEGREGFERVALDRCPVWVVGKLLSLDFEDLINDVVSNAHHGLPLQASQFTGILRIIVPGCNLYSSGAGFNQIGRASYRERVSDDQGGGG